MLINLMKQHGLAPIIVVLLIALTIGGIFLYQRQTKPVAVPQTATQSSPSPVGASSAPKGDAETANWKTYKDWHSGRFSFRHPDNWSLHSETILMYSDKSLRANLKDLPFDSYSEKYLIIKGKEILIRDVINAGQGYGRVVEARIPYKNNSYIWLTGRKEDLEDRRATNLEIDEFIKIVSTLIFK